MSDNKKKFSLIDILLPYQKTFVQDKHKKKIWLSSRQIGKSFTISYLMCYKVLQKPNLTGLCISTGARAAVELLKKCKQMAEAVKIISDGAITYTDNSESITFSNGSRILSLPSNPDALRGFSSAIVCIDECAFIPQVEDCWQAIVPTLTRNKDAELIVCSTPAGMSGLFYDFYTDADDSWYVQRTTIEDAVRDGLKVDINTLKANVQDPDIWEQEYMCRFSKEFGSFIDTSLLVFYDTLDSKQGGYYLGMDIGRKHDRTSISILKTIGDELFVDNIITLNKCEYQQQIQIVKDLNAKYQFQAGFIDEGGIGSAVAEQITKTISSKLCGMQFTGANKTPLYEAVRAKVFDHKLKFNSMFKEDIVKDFNNVRRMVTEDGKVKFTADRNDSGHSDLTSSLTLALEAARLHPMSFSQPQTHMPFSAFGSRHTLFGRTQV